MTTNDLERVVVLCEATGKAGGRFTGGDGKFPKLY
jgi:hypothetical protein